MPHLKELVELHQDDPFALVGVNTGDDPKSYRKGLEDYGVTWISAYQGDSTPIADLYKVRGYPTYFLIDADGVIVDSGHNGKAFDAKIKDLVAKAKAK